MRKDFEFLTELASSFFLNKSPESVKIHQEKVAKITINILKFQYKYINIRLSKKLTWQVKT
jgi:hypothetical protein